MYAGSATPSFGFMYTPAVRRLSHQAATVGLEHGLSTGPTNAWFYICFKSFHEPLESCVR